MTQASQWNQFEAVEYQVVHTTVGRIRIQVPRLANDPEYARKLQHLVKSLNFVISLRLNTSASSIVVNYDTCLDPLATVQSALVDAIQQALTRDIPLVPTPKAPPSTQETNVLEYLDLPVPEKSSQSHKEVMHQASVVSRSACLIFNPIAGQSNAKQDLEKIRSILEPELNLDVRTTTPEVDTHQLTLEAVDQRFEVIIASGGDGTVSAVASAVMETDIPLGIIPRGTANAFANALGIPTSIEGACATILAGTTRVVDAASCNGRPMILLTGIGFEAETVNRADRESKNQFGMLAYILAGLEELNELETFDAKLETDDKIITLQAAAVTVANLAPPTCVLAQGPGELIADDGLLDVTLAAPTNTLGALAAAYNLLQSAFLSQPAAQSDIGYLRTKRIKITTDPPQKVVKDGELIGQTPVEIVCIPGGLTIFVPTISESASPTEKLDGFRNLKIEPKEPGVIEQQNVLP